MNNIQKYLEEKLLTAFEQCPFGKHVPKKMITSIRILFLGKDDIEYTFTGLIGISKILKKAGINLNPIEIYNKISEHLDLNEKIDIKFVKGYINFYPKKDFMNNSLDNVKNLISKTRKPLQILVDFSSPNIAKDMHVGHLRSTIIGENICRYHEELGNNVSRINHIGDFGLPFGMIIQYMYETLSNFYTTPLTISNLQQFYAASKKRFDEDVEFKKLAYQRVVELQTGNLQTVEIWNLIKDISRESYNKIYKRLNTHMDEVGESFYQSMIPSLILELEEKGLLEEDKGRKIIKVPGFKLPLTVLKSNGTATYDTTDLAAVRYRLVDLNMDKVYYVVGESQSKHFKLIFKVAELAGWKKAGQELHHIGFGLILDESGKPFRSRSGQTEKLVDLLDKSLEKAKVSMSVKLTETQNEKVIKSIAYGAIKYYDLSFYRLTDYKFSYDGMLSLNGNTAVYLLYAYVRLSSILRKVKELGEDPTGKVNLETKEERMLGLYILRFPEVFQQIEQGFFFHHLCQYLYTLSKTFHTFFKNCRCIHYDENKMGTINPSRVKLCQLLKLVFEKSFYLLNIEPVSYM